MIKFYSGREMPVFLLDMFSKGEKANSSRADLNTLKALLTRIVELYQEESRS